MTLPITAYGHPTLRRVAQDIDPDYPGLMELIENMFETMYTSNGVGLAAPQVNLSIRLIVIDATPYAEEMNEPDPTKLKKVLINPYMIEEKGDEWPFNEGCLSIPDIREDVLRKPGILIEYYDENFNLHEEHFTGVLARIIQHEYDHLEGVLFVDRIPNIRKILLRKKLSDISKGNIDVDYKMIFPMKKKARQKLIR
ncbi:MAG: peptide deformylase [Bacteroidales bacterium]|nr:peptide deformylase [Bacteroidales bacterium]